MIEPIAFLSSLTFIIFIYLIICLCCLEIRSRKPANQGLVLASPGRPYPRLVPNLETQTAPSPTYTVHEYTISIYPVMPPNDQFSTKSPTISRTQQVSTAV